MDDFGFLLRKKNLKIQLYEECFCGCNLIYVVSFFIGFLLNYNYFEVVYFQFKKDNQRRKG